MPKHFWCVKNPAEFFSMPKLQLRVETRRFRFAHNKIEKEYPKIKNQDNPEKRYKKNGPKEKIFSYKI
jgi:hypothetical protein